jgi:hypothetical protein
MCNTSAVVAYALGLRSGLLLAQGAFIGVVNLVLGVRLRFGGRKDRLLIQHFDMAMNGHPHASEEGPGH